MDEQGWLPKLDYYLDESDPEVVVVRRQDGTFVAAFSTRGATREGIVEAAKENYRRLVSSLHFLDELPEEAAIVESSGTIVAVNEAWKRFAKDNGAELGKVSEGANYLGVCDGATGEQSEDARSFAEGSVRSCRAQKRASPWNILATRPPRGAGSWAAWGAWPTVIRFWLSSPTRT